MTPEMRAWVAERYASTPNGPLAEAFEAEFGVPVSGKSLMQVANGLGIRKAERGRVDPMGGHLDFVLGYGRTHTARETAEELERRYGVVRKPCSVSCALKRCGAGTARFVDGRQVPSNSSELLDVTVRNGHPCVKVGWFSRRRAGDNWVPLMRFEWERLHGPLPDGWVVLSVSGDRSDARPENMVACSRSVRSSLLQRFGGPPYASRDELESMVAICGVAVAANAAEDALDPKARQRRYRRDFEDRRNRDVRDSGCRRARDGRRAPRGGGEDDKPLDRRGMHGRGAGERGVRLEKRA